jgi:hypothetical protein
MRARQKQFTASLSVQGARVRWIVGDNCALPLGWMEEKHINVGAVDSSRIPPVVLSVSHALLTINTPIREVAFDGSFLSAETGIRASHTRATVYSPYRRQRDLGRPLGVRKRAHRGRKKSTKASARAASGARFVVHSLMHTDIFELLHHGTREAWIPLWFDRLARRNPANQPSPPLLSLISLKNHYFTAHSDHFLFKKSSRT